MESRPSATFALTSVFSLGRNARWLALAASNDVLSQPGKLHLLLSFLLLKGELFGELPNTFVFSDQADVLALTNSDSYEANGLTGPEVIQKFEADLLNLFETPDVPWLSLLLPMRVKCCQL